jgi:pimeloyl-ACP methyl ester carboxylesterase
MRIILTSILLAAIAADAQTSLATLHVDGKDVSRRYVLRVPPTWNGSLVIGAHGGSGGEAIDRAGKVYATSETALDDVIGRFVFDRGFAYASVDRDGIGGTRTGYSLTMQFAEFAKHEVGRRAARAGGAAAKAARVYIAGLSAGGGLARMAAEAVPPQFDGALIIAGAGGDLITRMDRQQRVAALWPLIDPRAHAGLPDRDPRIVSYAAAVGTPVAARRLWPYTGAAAATARPITGTVDNSSAQPSIPVIEVVGTWDDLVIREVRAYRDRVQPRDRHRLYEVEGVWHMSGDDDGVQGFQYLAETRMKLGKDVADAMGEGPSYIPAVREAFDYLVRWVEQGTAPPPNQTVTPAQPLRR